MLLLHTLLKLDGAQGRAHKQPGERAPHRPGPNRQDGFGPRVGGVRGTPPGGCNQPACGRANNLAERSWRFLRRRENAAQAGRKSRAVRHKGSKIKNSTKASKSRLIITLVKLFANNNCPNSWTIEGNTMNNSLILKYRGHFRSRTAQLIEDDSLDRSLLSD